MLTLEEIQEYMDINFGNEDGDLSEYQIDKYDLRNFAKHVLSKAVDFLELNEKKPIKSIINELKGKV